MRTFPFKVPEVKLATTSGEEAGGASRALHRARKKRQDRKRVTAVCSLFGVPEVKHFAYVCPPICS